MKSFCINLFFYDLLKQAKKYFYPYVKIIYEIGREMRVLK